MESTLKRKYRIKLVEKCYYLMLLVFGFMVYKSPSLLSYMLSDHPIISISFFGLSIIVFSMANWYLDKKGKRSEALVKKLKEQMKDAKRLLISQMDPIMIETVKEIVKADMREEIERLRNSADGCSEKCLLTNKMLKLDIGRHEMLMQELIQFKWCDVCKAGAPNPGAANTLPCQSACGGKLFSRLVPHMKDFGRVG